VLSIDELDEVLANTTEQIENLEKELGRKLSSKEFIEELGKFSKKNEESKSKHISACCVYGTIPPEWEMADKAGSLWRAYTCHICKKCEEPCEVIDK